MPGPLSPGYAAQVPYNYNQLEGRFKQLQGKAVLFFSRCCYDMIPVNMFVWACSCCIKVLMRPNVVLWEKALCSFQRYRGAFIPLKVSSARRRVNMRVQPLSRSALQMRTNPTKWLRTIRGRVRKWSFHLFFSLSKIQA